MVHDFWRVVSIQEGWFVICNIKGLGDTSAERTWSFRRIMNRVYCKTDSGQNTPAMTKSFVKSPLEPCDGAINPIKQLIRYRLHVDLGKSIHTETWAVWFSFIMRSFNEDHRTQCGRSTSSEACSGDGFSSLYQRRISRQPQSIKPTKASKVGMISCLLALSLINALFCAHLSVDPQ